MSIARLPRFLDRINVIVGVKWLHPAASWRSLLPKTQSRTCLIASRFWKVSTLYEPVGQDAGEARRFLDDLASAWNAFHGIETMEALAKLRFDDERTGHLSDLPDITEELLGMLTAFVEIPHAGSVHAVTTVWRQQGPPYDLELSYEGLDGPLVLRFNDDTHLAGNVIPKKTVQSRWDAGVSTWLVQQQLEAIVSLAKLAEVANALPLADQQIADAILVLLARLSGAPEPPRSVVREALRWLGQKVDVFADEAAKTGGKAAGALATGTAGYVAMKYVPGLREAIRDALRIAG